MKRLPLSFAFCVCLCASVYAQTSPVQNLSGSSTIWGLESGENAGQLVLNNTADSSFSGIIQNVSSSVLTNIVKTGANTLSLTGSNSYTGTTTVSEGTLAITLVANRSLNATVGENGTLEISNTGVSNFMLDGILSGAGTLKFNTTTGREPIYNMNGDSFTGTLEIAQGIVQFNSVKLGTAKIVLSGGTLKNYSISRTISNNITLADGTSSSLRCGWSSGSILNLTGEISGKGSLEIANDQYTVQLSNSNTYSGGTKIGGGKNGWGGGGQGTLVLAAENALGTGAVTFGSNNSSLNFGGFDQSFGGLDNTNGAGYYTGISVVSTVSGTQTPIDLALNVAQGASYTYSETMPTLTSITKSGAGTQTFVMPVSASTIAVSNGLLKLNVEANSTATYNLTGGTLEISNIGDSNVMLGGTLSGAGTLKFNTTTGREPIYNMNGDSFTGTLEIAQGIVQFNSVKLGTAEIVLSGGTLKNYSALQKIDRKNEL